MPCQPQPRATNPYTRPPSQLMDHRPLPKPTQYTSRQKPHRTPTPPQRAQRQPPATPTSTRRSPELMDHRAPPTHTTSTRQQKPQFTPILPRPAQPQQCILPTAHRPPPPLRHPCPTAHSPRLLPVRPLLTHKRWL
jgi:hypothetical protein